MLKRESHKTLEAPEVESPSLQQRGLAQNRPISSVSFVRAFLLLSISALCERMLVVYNDWHYTSVRAISRPLRELVR
jgi:hypothetical protein